MEESEETTNPEAAKGRLVSRQAVLTARRGNFSKVDINLEPGAALEVSVKQLDEKGTPLSLERKRFENELPIKEQVTTTPLIKEGVNTKVLSKINHKTWLFLAALAVYLLTRFIGLDSYPIYFFTDEAVQTVLASDLVQNDFRDYEEEFLPTYFKNGGQYNLGTSVYFQIVPWLLFGKSIWVTRGTSVLISLLAAISIGLMLKNIFKTEYAFAGILLFGSTPAWFLHSRTAFETVTAVAFYAAFLYTYLRYRQGNPKALPLAVLFGAICFYSYSPAQMVVAVTALLFLILDFRTHLRNKKIVLLSVVIAAVMAIPYVRFLILHPDENRRHLEILNSYLIKDISLFEKANIFFSEYFKMINPLYWFAPNPAEIERHLMKGYGHLPIWSAPFFFLGLWRLIKNLRQSENRSVFIALLTAPAGAALAGAAITRALFLVVPAVLVIAIGLEEVLGSLKKSKLSSIVVSLVVFVGLSAVNIFMLRDALVNGPLWYSNYSLSGQQYGARQVFSEIKTLLEEDADRTIFLSPSWANGTDVVARFFLDEPTNFEMGSIENYLLRKVEFDTQQIFILIPEEMERAVSSRKFKTIETIKILNYPNGEPGFYFLHLNYVDHVDDLFAQEEMVRNTLYEITLQDKQKNSLRVSFPALDMGAIEYIFDGDNSSFIRSQASNPMKLFISPLETLELNQIILLIGGTGTSISISIEPADDTKEVILEKVLEEASDFRNVVFSLEYSMKIKRIEISIENTYDTEYSHVHLWELTLQ